MSPGRSQGMSIPNYNLIETLVQKFKRQICVVERAVKPYMGLAERRRLTKPSFAVNESSHCKFPSTTQPRFLSSWGKNNLQFYSARGELSNKMRSRISLIDQQTLISYIDNDRRAFTIAIVPLS